MVNKGRCGVLPLVVPKVTISIPERILKEEKRINTFAASIFNKGLVLFQDNTDKKTSQ